MLRAQHLGPLRRQRAEPYAIREAYGAADEIMVRPIKSSITYAVAPHEIGHNLGRNQKSWLPMVRERWAWQWARVNALNWTDTQLGA